MVRPKECHARDFSLPLRLTVCRFENHSMVLMKAYSIVSVTFSKRPRDIFSCVCGDKVRYMKPKRDLFLSPTKCFLCLNLTKA